MHVSLCCVSSRSQYQAPWGLLSAKHHAGRKLCRDPLCLSWNLPLAPAAASFCSKTGKSHLKWLVLTCGTFFYRINSLLTPSTVIATGRNPAGYGPAFWSQLQEAGCAFAMHLFNEKAFWWSTSPVLWIFPQLRWLRYASHFTGRHLQINSSVMVPNLGHCSYTISLSDSSIVLFLTWLKSAAAMTQGSNWPNWCGTCPYQLHYEMLLGIFTVSSRKWEQCTAI